MPRLCLMMQQPPPPPSLAGLQYWFASIIERPIDGDSNINPVTPSGNLIGDEAAYYIRPSPTLHSYQRIEIYNQQYWWRLLSTLHESFPMLTRLFGYYAFNQEIGFPYICRYRPEHWSLSHLGSHLPLWVQQHYHGPDKEVVLFAAQMDQAYNYSFIAKHQPPITYADLETAPESFFSQNILLQPHIQLFSMRHHLFALRDQLIENNPEYWEEKGLPSVEKQKKLHFMVWRDERNNVGWLELPSIEAHLLAQFQTGISLNDLLAWIEKQSKTFYSQCTENLREWSQRWVLNEWLYLPKGQ